MDGCDYPRIYKVEVLNDQGPFYIVLYEIFDEEDEFEDYKKNRGPNHMFEVFIAHPECPGFTTLLEDIKSFSFDKWSDLPFIEQIRYGEAAAEYAHIVDGSRNRNLYVAEWDEDCSDEITVFDEEFSDWVNS